MTWNETNPDDNINLPNNAAKQRDTNVYIRTQMNKDHFWDAVNEGHHRHVNFKTKGAGDATVTLDGVVYVRKDATDTVTGTKELYYKRGTLRKKLSEPFNIVGAGLVSNGNVTPLGSEASLDLGYNIDKVVHTATGVWTVHFKVALPDVKYMVFLAKAGSADRGLTAQKVDKTKPTFIIRGSAYSNNGIKDITDFQFLVYQ